MKLLYFCGANGHVHTSDFALSHSPSPVPMLSIFLPSRPQALLLPKPFLCEVARMRQISVVSVRLVIGSVFSIGDLVTHLRRIQVTRPVWPTVARRAAVGRHSQMRGDGKRTVFSVVFWTGHNRKHWRRHFLCPVLSWLYLDSPSVIC